MNLNTYKARLLLAFLMILVSAGAYGIPSQDNIDGIWQDTYVDSVGIPSASNVTIGSGVVSPTDCSMPGEFISSIIAPSGLSDWEELSIDGVVPSGGMTVEVYADDDVPSTVTGPILATGSSFPLDLSGIDADANPILEVRVILNSSPPAAVCPALSTMSLSWEPESTLLLDKRAPAEVGAGNTFTYTLRVSASNTNAEDVVVWDQLPEQALGTVMTDYDYGQGASEDPVFSTAILGGEYTAVAIVVNGVNVPANAVYWDLGTVDAGVSLALKYSVDVPDTTLDGTQYLNLFAAESSNAENKVSPQAVTEIRNAPRSSVKKLCSGNVLMRNENLCTLPPDEILTFNLSVSASNEDEPLLDVLVYDDLTNTCALAAVDCPADISAISDGGAYNAAYDHDGDAGTATIEAIVWPVVTAVPPGIGRTYDVDLTGVPAGTVFDNTVCFDSLRTTTASCDDLSIEILDPSPGGGGGKGGPHGDIGYGSTISYNLGQNNTGLVSLNDLIMFDRIPDELEFSSLSVASAANATVFYSTNTSFTDPNTPPDYDIGAIDGVAPTDIDVVPNTYWDTALPADPSTVTWVAIYTPQLSSVFYPPDDPVTSVSAQISARVRDDGDLCLTPTVTNTGLFQINAYTDLPDPPGTLTPIAGAALAAAGHSNNIKPFTPEVEINGNNSGVSPDPLNIAGQQVFTFTITNKSDADTAQDVDVTLTWPQLLINGVLSYPGLSSATGGSLDLSNIATGELGVNVGLMAPGESKPVTLTLTIPQGIADETTYTVNALIVAADDACGPVQTGGSLSATLLGLPSLNVVKTVSPALISPGSVLNYEFTYSNSGPGISTGTYVVDALPDKAVMLDATLSHGEQFYCSGPPLDAGLPTGLSPAAPLDATQIAAYFTLGTDTGGGVWTCPFGEAATWYAVLVDDSSLAPDQLPVAGARTFSMRMRNDEDPGAAQVDSPDGTVWFNAPGIFSNELLQAIGNSVINVVSDQAALKVEKTGPNPSIVGAGGTFEWVIEFENNSTATLDTAVITDALPAGTSFVSATFEWNAEAQANGAPAGVQAITPVGDDFNIAPGERADLLGREGGTIVMTVTTDQDVPSGTLILNTACGNGVDGGGTGVPEVCDSDVVEVQNPELELNKLASPPNPRSGDTITYTLLIKNHNLVAAPDIVITDELPAEVTYTPGSTQLVSPAVQYSIGEPTVSGSTLTWDSAGGNALTDISLGADTITGDSGDIVIQYEVTVNAAISSGTQLINKASVATSAAEDGVFESVTDCGGTATALGFQNTDCTTGVSTPYPDPQLLKDGDTVASPGGDAIHTITYRNGNNEDALDVYVIDTLPDVDSGSGGDADTDVTYLTNNAPAGVVAYYSAVAGTAPVFDPTDPLTSGDWSATPTSPVNHIAWLIGTLAANDGPYDITVSIRMIDPSSGSDVGAGLSFVNNATIFTSSTDGDPGNNTDTHETITPGVDMQVEKVGSSEGAVPGIAPGGSLTYTVTYTNTGTETAYGIRIEDTLPAGVSFVSDDFTLLSLVDDNGLPCSAQDVSGNSLSGSIAVTRTDAAPVYEWSVGGASPAHQAVGIPVGCSQSFTMTVQLDNDLAEFTVLQNRVRLRTDNKVTDPPLSDPDTDPFNCNELYCDNNQDFSEVTVLYPDLVIAKSVVDSGTGSEVETNPGSILTYTIEYDNIGNIGAENVEISEVIPTGTSYVPGSLVLPDGATSTFSPAEDASATDFSVNFTSLPAPANFEGEALLCDGGGTIGDNCTMSSTTGSNATSSGSDTNVYGGKLDFADFITNQRTIDYRSLTVKDPRTLATLAAPTENITWLSDIGDLDGDGVQDIAYGQPFGTDTSTGENNSGSANRGEFYIAYLNADGTIRNNEQFKYSPFTYPEHFGPNGNAFSFDGDGVGDLDGDGVPDIAIRRGSAITVLMNSDGTIKNVGTTAATDRNRVGVGDLDGNGIGDIVSAQTWTNTLYCTLINPDGSSASVTTISTSLTIGATDRLRAVNDLGDFNGDGFQDVIWGGGGEVQLVLMGANCTVTDSYVIDMPDGWGGAAAQVGDIDGDGVTDILVTNSTGSALLMFLNADGTVKTSLSDSFTGINQYVSIDPIGELNDINAPSIFAFGGANLHFYDIQLLLENPGSLEFTFSATNPVSAWNALTVSEEVPDGTTLFYTLGRQSGGSCVYDLGAAYTDVNMTANAGYLDISGVSISETDLCLRADFTTSDQSDFSLTPQLNAWQVSYRSDERPSFTFQVQVDHPYAESGIIPNTAVISTTTPESDTSNNQDDDEIQVPLTDLEVTKSVDQTAVSLGDAVPGPATLTYTLDYINNGPSTAELWSLTDVLPPEMDLSTVMITPSLTSQGNTLMCGEPVVTNLAADCTTNGLVVTSSASDNGTVATDACDGNTAGNWNNGTIFWDSGANPFWQIDLGSEQFITDVVIWARTNGNRYLVGAELQVLDAGFTPVFTAALADAGPSQTILANTVGRYVRIDDTGSSELMLPEVEVYTTALVNPPTSTSLSCRGSTSTSLAAGESGTVTITADIDPAPPIVLPTTNNLAADCTTNGLVVTSSSPDSGTVATDACDGNTAGNWNNGSIFYDGGANPFWQIDLGSEQILSDIVIWGRTNGGILLSGAELQVLDASLNPVYTATLADIQPTQTFSASVTNGRYVRIERSVNQLMLPEVQIFEGVLDPLETGDLLVNNVSIETITAESDLTNNGDSAQTLITDIANVYITKDGPASATLGGQIVYTLAYGNDGNLDAVNVVVADALPAGCSYDAAAQGLTSPLPNSVAGQNLTWSTLGATAGTLIAGETGSITVACTVTDPLLVGTSITNNVVITTTTPELTETDNQDDHDTIITVELATLAGVVFHDADQNNAREVSETPIAGVTITLTGTDIFGDPVLLTTTTDTFGAYSFVGLNPSDASGYTVTETQPTSWESTASVVGTVDAVVTGSGGTTDPSFNQITGIVLGGGDLGINYDFGEFVPMEMSKTAGMVTDNGAGVFTATYTVTAANTANAPTLYSYTDLPTAPAGTTLTSVTLAASAASAADITTTPGNGVTSASVTDEPIVALGIETWDVTVVFTLTDATALAGAALCTDQATAEGGFANEILSSTDTDTTNNDACLPVPNATIDLAKSVSSGPTDNMDGTYTVEYTVTATNSSSASGVYDVIEDFRPGMGIALITASVTYGGEVDGSDGTITTPLANDGTAVSAESLSGGESETWVINATFAVDQTMITTEGSDCDITNTGLTNTGFNNNVSGSSTDTDNTNNDACVALPLVDLSKVVDSAVDNNDGSFTVTYTISAENTGSVIASYDVVESIEPGTGITVSTTTLPTVTYPASNTDGSSGLDINSAVFVTDTAVSFDPTTDSTVVSGESIAAGATETWTLIVVYDVDPTMITATDTSALCNADLADATGGGGFANVVTTNVSTDDTSDNEACTDLPIIDLAKSITSGPTDNMDGTYTVEYTITATNTGSTSGVYDVIEDFRPGVGITLTTATVAYGGETDGTDGTITTPLAADGTAVDDESLAGGATESFVITATFAVDPATITAAGSDCDVTNAGLTDTGFNNNVSGSSTDTDTTNNDACAGLAIIDLAKSITSGPTDNMDGTYTVEYTITATNTGSTSGVYDVVEDFRPGVGITLTTATVAYGGEADGTDGTITTPLAADGTAVDDESLAGGATESFVITATYAVDPATITAAGSDCDVTNAGLTDTGFNNNVTGSSTDTDATNNDACAGLAIIDLAKSITSGPTDNMDGTYTVEYTITATNTGSTSGVYDVIEDFRPGVGITLTTATVVYGGETDGTDGTITTPLASDGTAVDDESLAGGATESFVITATFAVDPASITAAGSDCDVTNAGLTDTGFNNNVTGSSTDTDTTNNDACAGLAIIDLAKSITSGPTDNMDGTYTVEYTITATNTGSTSGVYDVIEDFRPGVGITLTTATVAYGGEADGTDGTITTPLAADGTAVDDESLAGGATESFVITATFAVDPATITAEGSDCDVTNTGLTDTGFNNNVTGSSTDTDATNNDACAGLAIIDLAKSITSGPTDNMDGTYTVEYTITATNTGSTSGVYDVVEDFRPGVGITLTTATVAYGGETDGTDGTITTPLAADGTAVDDESLAGGATESFVITATFAVDPATITAAGSDCDVTNAGLTDTGFNNNVTGSSTDTDTTNNDACAGLAIIDLAKSITSGPTDNMDGTYTVEYTITATNTGSTSGVYDVIEDFRPGIGITLTTATVAYGGEADGTDGTITTPLAADGTAVDDESLAGGATESFVITATFAVDPATITAAGSDCDVTNAGLTDTGFNNNVTGSSTDTDATNNDACAGLAIIDLAKSITSGPTDNMDGTYTVEYTITATNTGSTSGIYDVIEDFRPGVGIALTTATVAYGGEADGTDGTITTPLAADGTAVDDESLAGGATESFVITATFAVDPATITAEGSDCDVTNTGLTDTGFNNNVTGSSTDTDTTNNDACAALPIIDLAKSITSGPTDNMDGTYTVEYTITATNTGSTSGVYDVVEDFRPGVGITLTTATVAYGGEADGTDGTITTPIAADGTAVDNESLAGGASESFVITATFAVDPATITAEGSDCDATNAGLTDTGFNNNVSGSSTDTDTTNNDACAALPIIDLAKTVTAGPTDNMDGTYTVEYTITATNTGSTSGVYDVVEDFRPGVGITLTTATVVYGGEADGTDGTITTPLAADGTAVDNESLAGGATESFVITATYAVDPATITAAGSDCDITNTGLTDTGFNNNVTGSSTDTDATNNDACAALPIIDLAKTVTAGPTDNMDGTYTVEYTITATNTGSTSGVYDVIEDFRPGVGITLTTATVAYGGEADGTDGTITTPLAADGTAVDDESLAGGATESFVITATFAVDPATITAAGSDCDVTNAGLTDTGFNNNVTGSSTDTDTTNNDACAGLAIIDLAKSITSGPTDNMDGTYTVEYTITATNTGSTSGVYDVVEDFRPGVGITLTTATVVYGGEADGTDGTITTPLASDGTAVDDESLAGGASESFVITATFAVDPATITAEGSDCDATNAGLTDTGFNNNVSGSSTDTDTTNNDACAALPIIDLAKTVTAGPTDNMDGTYTVEYTITATNTGSTSGVYDVVEDFRPGVGITLTTATVVYGGEADGTDGTITTPLAADGTAVDNESLAGGATESFVITATYAVDPATITAAGSDCDITNTGLTDTGFNNNVTGSSTDTDATNNDACAALPIIDLAKTVTAGPTDNMDGTYTVEYTITATNTGSTSGVYDVIEDFRPGVGITLTTATVAYGGEADGTDGTITTPLAADGTAVDDESLAGGATESFVITATFAVDPATITAAGSDCDVTNAGLTDTGFNNNVTGSSTDTDTTNNDACAGLAIIDLAKSITSGPTDNMDGTYTVEYTITATNTGSTSGIYDVIEDFRPGVGITLTTATVAYGGEADGTDGTITTPLAADGTAVNDESLASGATESFVITATFAVDPATITAEGSDCDVTNAGLTDTGFNNNVTGSSTDTDTTNNDACTLLPPATIDLSKSVLGSSVDNGDGTFTVTYAISAENTGSGPGTYDLIESIEPGTGITVSGITAPTLVYDASNTDGQTGTITAAPLPSTGLWVDDEPLVAGATETWTITVVYDVDPSIVTATDTSALCNADVTDATGGGGFANVVTSDATNDSDTSNNEACVDVELSPSSLGDRVWLDENGDGVQDPGEDGIANVTVTLTHSDPTIDLGAGPGVAITRVTDSNGEYLFTELPPGDYTVTVVDTTLASGLAANPTYDEDDGVVGPGGVPSTIHTTVVNLDAGEDHRTADFGYNWSSPGDTDNPDPGALAALGDRIWLDVDGDGAQDAGEVGIAGVTVNLLNEAGAVIATTTTDADGRYIFDDLAAGAYQVEVDDSTLPVGLVQTGDPDDFGIAATNPDHLTTTPIVLAPGDVFVNADFGYQPGNGGTDGSDIGDTIYIDSDGDGVEDAGEPGIAGVTVSLLDGAGNVIATTITDARGSYLFESLPAGDYQVVVTDVNNALSNLKVNGNPIDDTGPLDNEGSVITLDGVNDNLDQDFGYVPEGHTAGDGLIGDTIYLDINSDGIEDATDPGIQGVTVRLYDAGGALLDSVQTDANGQYLFGGLDPTATYTVTVDAMTLPAGLYPTADPDDDGIPANGDEDNTSRVDLSLTGGVNLEQDYGYSANNPVTPDDESNSLSGTLWEDLNADGTLTDADEAGRFAGVTIDVYGDPDGDMVFDTLIATTTTDANGDYSVTGLPDGVYEVKVTDNNNVLAGNWHSDGVNDGADNNSQVNGYRVDLDAANASALGVTDTTSDFGFYNKAGALGNTVWRDLDGDGLFDPATEPGIEGVEVTLLITYPNGDTATLTTTTDLAGHYEFGNLLLDEDGNGTAGSPTYSVSVDTASATNVLLLGQLSSVYSGNTDSTTVGGTAGDDDDLDVGGDDPSAEPGFPLKGGVDATNDFGFMPTGSIGNRVWQDGDGDGIQDGNEDGIANVLVTLRVDTNNDGIPDTDVESQVTGPDGEYLFTDVVPGIAYEVVVDDSTLPPGVVQTFDEDDGATTTPATPHASGPIIVSPGEEHLTADFGYQLAPGSIGDTVWVDADGDGIQDPGENGIAGIPVYLQGDTDGDGLPDTVLSTTTDANGKYIFTGLTEGTYVVVVNPSDTTNPVGSGVAPTGYTAHDAGDPDVRDGFSPSADNETTVVLTNEGGTVTSYVDADFGYLPPTDQNNTVGDFVWLDSNGDGVQDAGEAGIAGVTVALIDQATGTVVASTITDANGGYLFTGVPDGLYEVEVTDTNAVLGGLQQTYDEDDGASLTPTTPNRTLVDVDSGSTNALPEVIDTADFGYFNPTNPTYTGVIGDTVFFDVDGSGVQDASENGLEGVWVGLYTPGPDGVFGTADDVLVGVENTNENGQYSFSGLPTSDTGEDYQVRVDPTSLPNSGAGWVNSADPDAVLDGVSEVTLTTASPIDLDQDFGYQGDVGGNNAIEGTLWVDNDGDGMLIESGRFENVSIELLDTNGNIVATTLTDVNGNYRFEGLPDGIYTVVVTDVTNVLAGYEHTDGPTPGSDLNSQNDQGYTVDLDSANAIAEAVLDVTSDFGYEPAVSNPITMGTFTSEVDGGRIWIRWSTQVEVGNVGFHLYGKVSNETDWVRLNEDLIIGAGDSIAEHQYEFLVYNESYNEGYKAFLLSDVDIYGKEQLHGPYRINRSYGVKSSRKATDWQAIKQGKAEKRKAKRLRKQRKLQRKLNRLRQQSVSQQQTSEKRPWFELAASVLLAAFISDAEAQTASSDTSLVNLLVNESRVYALSHADLMAKGINLAGIPLAELALIDDHGAYTPLELDGSASDDAFFGPGASLRFIGDGQETLYSDQRAYTLVRTSDLSSARVLDDPSDLPQAATSLAYRAQVSHAPQAKYSYNAPGDDPWYAERLLSVNENGDETSIQLPVDYVVTGSSIRPVLSVSVWGATDLPGATADHHVQVLLNGSVVKERRFDGIRAETLAAKASSLSNGNNQVVVRLPHEHGFVVDQVNLESVTLSYPRAYVSNGLSLRFSSSDARFSVRKLNSKNTAVYRRDRNGEVHRLSKAVQSGICDTGQADCVVSFAGYQERSEYFVETLTDLAKPEIALIADTSGLFTGAAEYVIIAHSDFIDVDSQPLQALIEELNGEFNGAALVDVEAVMAAYGHVADADAIKQYIKQISKPTSANGRGTRYVLLVGADMFDYHHYLNDTGVSFIPTLYRQTDPVIRHAPVDSLFADIDGDQVQDIAIGRLPVRTEAELLNVMNKRSQYLQRSYKKKAVFLADQEDIVENYDFGKDADSASAAYFSDWQVTQAQSDDLGNSQARTTFIEAINQGQSLASYYGHSSTAQWSFNGLFTGDDVTLLNNQNRPTVVTQWGCWNTYYVSPTEDSMAVRLLLEDNKGAVSVMGASTFTEAHAEKELSELVYQQLAAGARLGDAMVEAKQQFAEDYPYQLDVLLGWTLLGFPELRIH